MVSVLAALGLVVAHLVRFARVPELWGWSDAGRGRASAWSAADFVSGVVHWAGDTWGSERTPWLGPRFIRPFRFHHAHPLDMLKSHFFTTNGDTALASLPFLFAPFAIPLDTRPAACPRSSCGRWAVGGCGPTSSTSGRT